MCFANEIFCPSSIDRLKSNLRRLYMFILSFSFSDQLKRHYNLGQFYLEVDLQDLTSFDEQLADKLTKSPAEFLPLVSIRS